MKQTVAPILFLIYFILTKQRDGLTPIDSKNLNIAKQLQKCARLPSKCISGNYLATHVLIIEIGIIELFVLSDRC
jgi:hypothetical protein